MNLKKSLKSKGQAALEYFILLAIIMGLSLISLSSFLPKVRDAVQGSETSEGYFQKAMDRIIYADQR